MTAPLDTVKIRLQVQRHNALAVSTIKHILHQEGVKALWKGNVPAEIMYILYGATQFASFSLINKSLNALESSTGVTVSAQASSLIVGSGAGITSTLVTYPFDLLRTRLAAHQLAQFLRMKQVVGAVHAKEGVLGFFVGIKPSLLSVAANTGIMFWLYELAREVSRKHDLPFIEGICGFVAGASAKAITFPLDTVRKRVQVYELRRAVGVFFDVLRNEGVRALYRGFPISLMKTAPTSAISMYVYELSLQWM